ncbi:MAG: CopG family transcriptional regulator [Clostridia bacterium]|jgi:putative iron-only hydrogenase system regulator|nr:CopG family transcriptional regulator [Clostridia bacterium]
MIALIGILVRNEEAAERVNELLHDYRDAVCGRLGLPLRDKGLNVISVVLDTDAGRVNALTGKLGRLPDVKAKALYGNE